MGPMLPLVCSLMIVFASFAGAEEVARKVPGIAPRILTVLSVDQGKGELMLIERTVRFVSEGRSVATGDGGKADVATKLMPVYEARAVGQVSLDTAEVFEAGGKKLSKE